MPAQDTTTQDKMFVKTASEGGQAEIQLSKIAMKRSSNPEVKAYAQKMVEDHTTLLNNMMPVAQSLNVNPAKQLNAMHKQEGQRLMAVKGEKLDMEYVQDMVTAHHKDVADFTAEENSTQNAQLKSTVSDALVVIKQHTEMIDAMASKMGMATPPSAQ